MSAPKLGITVMPEYLQSEGIPAVLDQVMDRAGARSVTTSPYVAAQAVPGRGEREPPDDGGKGTRRLLDRPLWGRREVWMETAPSFVPDPALYDGLVYRPPQVTRLSDTQGAVIGQFLDAAAARGADTWLQIQAAIPPGHRVQFGGPAPGDHPMLPDGSAGGARPDRNVSLGSEDLRAYMRAFVTDVCRSYPQAKGIKFDWPEYPVYTFDSLFFDFNPGVAPLACDIGLDLASLARGAGEFLSELGDGTLRRKHIVLDDLDGFLASLFAAYPMLGELLALKTAVVEDYARFLRDVLDTASGGAKRLFLQSFPPPLNRATGLDLARAGAVADVVGVKLYTMHWPLIEADIIASLQTRADLPGAYVAQLVSRLLALSPEAPRDPAAIRYPEPAEPHPAAGKDLAAKISQARADLPGTVDLVAISHGYGPSDDMIRRLRAVCSAGAQEVHINRYCYLSDAKLDAIGARVANAI